VAVIGRTASEETAGGAIMRYFGIWVDELRKTREEPDGTAGVGTDQHFDSFLPSFIFPTQTVLTVTKCDRALWNVRLVACFGVC
jgi:hypothetical protein